MLPSEHSSSWCVFSVSLSLWFFWFYYYLRKINFFWDTCLFSFIYFRVEAIGQVEYMLSEVKIIEFEHNCIRLFVKMSIPTSDGLVLGRKLDCAIEPCISDHELLIEVMDQTMELKSVEVMLYIFLCMLTNLMFYSDPKSTPLFFLEI